MALKLVIVALSFFLVGVAHGAAPTWVSTGTGDQVSSGNCVPGNPASIQNNDILVLVSMSIDTVNHTVNNGYTTKLEATVNANSDGSSPDNLRLEIHWKRTTGTESATTVTHSAGSYAQCIIFALRGAEETGDPFDVVGTIERNSTSEDPISTASITTTVANTLILHIAAEANGTAWASLTGKATTEQIDRRNSPHETLGLLVATGEQATAAATGTSGADKTGPFTYFGGSVQMAVKEETAPSGGGPPPATIPSSSDSPTFCWPGSCGVESIRPPRQSVTSPTVSARTCATDTTVTVPGAEVGDECVFAENQNPAIFQNCFVSAADTVKIRWCNHHASISDGGVATSLDVNVLKAGGLRGTATIDLGVINTLTCSDQTFTVTGAREGMVCAAGVPADVNARFSWQCWVSANNTVKLRICNGTGTNSTDPASGIYSVRVGQGRNGWGTDYRASADMASVNGGADGFFTFAVPDAVVGHLCYFGPADAVMLSGLLYECMVSATNTVRIKVYNTSGSAQNPPLAVYTIQLDR